MEVLIIFLLMLLQTAFEHIYHFAKRKIADRSTSSADKKKKYTKKSVHQRNRNVKEEI